VLVGHSGGAALVGDLIGTYLNLADAAVLVACPCEVPSWRAHMQEIQPLNWAWSFPVRSVSPHQLANRVSRKIPVWLVAGENDEVVPLSIIQGYVQLLTKNGVNARLVVLPQEGHEILLDPRVGKEITEFVRGTNFLETHKKIG
jgi:pimeloyl-ACP methyl ester carboxylesterase